MISVTLDDDEVDDDVGLTVARIAKLLIAMVPLALLLIAAIVVVGLGVPWLYSEWISRILDDLRF